MKITGRLLGKMVLVGIAGLLIAQVVPYGRNHTNPPVVREPAWDSPQTRALAKRACFDCHSHETVWPWYSNVAPISWLVQYDVDKGREELNFSDWRGGGREGERPGKIGKEVAEGEMPPFQYLITHPEARLSDGDKRALVEGLTATAARR
jgi:cytochrome c551/c552